MDPHGIQAIVRICAGLRPGDQRCGLLISLSGPVGFSLAGFTARMGRRFPATLATVSISFGKMFSPRLRQTGSLVFRKNKNHLSSVIPSHPFLTQSANMFWVKMTHSPFRAKDLGVGR